MLRVGIVGLNRGKSYYDVFSHYSETKVVAVCDKDERLIKEFLGKDEIEKVYIDFKEFLSHHFDIAVIATPLPFYVDHSVAALESGKHVLCEVPLGMSIEECKRSLIAVKGARNLKYMMAANANYFYFVRQWHKRMFRDQSGR